MQTLGLIPSAKAACLVTLILTVFAVCAPGQVSTSNSVPTVFIYATSPNATFAGKQGLFSVFRQGDTNQSLSVYYCVSGTAANGVDYRTLSNTVALPRGMVSNSITIRPINHGQTSVETVIIELCPSPMLPPVNYVIGSPSNAVVYISPASSAPPVVRMVNPTNGTVYQSPVNIPLLAQGSNTVGTLSKVEFFAGAADLGPGQLIVLDPPGVNGVTGPVYFLNWSNVPPNAYSLSAVVTDVGGITITSAPVAITVLGPGTNNSPTVRITSPPNGATFRAPMNVPIIAYASDYQSYISSVQFFADGNSLGFGSPIKATAWSALGTNYVGPTNTWGFIWTNPPPETNIILNALATDSSGLSGTSAPVAISVLPSLPTPTNRPPIVGVIASDPVAIEGTNCWPWLTLAGSAITNGCTWSNWTSPTAVFCWATNCGPKDATFTVFRIGETNNDLNVSYEIGGSASNGVDYVALLGNVVIPAGQRSVGVTVVPLDDGPPDMTSTVILKIAPTTNYVVGLPASAGAIILDSGAPVSATGMLPGNVFHLSVNGPNGAWFHVEQSADLVNWIPVCTNQIVNGSIDFVDPNSAVQVGGYYRVVPELAPSPQ